MADIWALVFLHQGVMRLPVAYVPGEGELATEQKETGAGSPWEQKVLQKCGHSALKL